MIGNCGDTTTWGKDAIEETGESSNSTVTDEAQGGGLSERPCRRRITRF